MVTIIDMVTVTEFKNKSGKTIPFMKIDTGIIYKNGTKKYVNIGFKKAQAVLDHSEEILKILNNQNSNGNTSLPNV